MSEDDLITVCDACEQASCWHGIFFCEDYKVAGIKQMTRAAWAERAINKLPMALGSDPVDAKAAIKLVEAEHKRAVRVVKRQLDLYQRQREVEKDEHRRDLLAGSIFACVDLLESLQRGR